MVLLDSYSVNRITLPHWEKLKQRYLNPFPYTNRMRYLLKCMVCGHEWKAYKAQPRACPKCKSYINYSTERTQAIPIPEEEEREPTPEEIEASLKESEDKGVFKFE